MKHYLSALAFLALLAIVGTVERGADASMLLWAVLPISTMILCNRADLRPGRKQ